MAGTYVLVAMLTTTFCSVVFLAAIFSLAKRNDQGVKKVSFSPRHGFTAEYFDSVRRNKKK
jgi:hypothetical protein